LAKRVIGGYCHTEALSDERSEAFTPDVESFLFSSIEQAVEQQDIPVALMKKSHKLQVVKELDAQGVFLLRGAVAKIAESLHVSRYTVYNYLEEIRNSSERMLRQ
jgi:predicted transcriptional regulator YheO